MTTTYDKDGAYIEVTVDGVVHRRSIRWIDCVISVPSGTNLKIDSVHVNDSNQLVLVLEDDTEITVADVIDHGGLTGLTDDDHTQYILKSIFDAQTVLVAVSDDTPVALSVTEQTLVGRITGGNIAALTVAQIRTLLNVEDGAAADLTGAEIVALLEALSSSSRLSHTKLDDVGADDHHTEYTDVKAKAAAVQSGAITDGVTKAPTHDAVFEVKATAEAALTPAEHTTIGDSAPHHAASHNIASHNDTTATGTELEELTDGSQTILHSHAADGAGATAVIKPDDQIVNNSTTLVNDEDLVIAVGADDVWFIYFRLNVYSPSSTPDIKYLFSVPAGGAFTGRGVWSLTDASGYANLTTERTINIGPAVYSIQFFGVYVGGGTAGNLQLEWAQKAATVEDTKIKEDSMMVCQQVA